MDGARSAIAQNISGFVFREGGAAALRDLFHPDAAISVSWYSGGIDGFMQASRPLVLARHSFGLPRIHASGSRALSEVDVTIRWRTRIGHFEVDVTAFARFFDRFVRGQDGRWRVLERTAIHDKDRMDPVRPSLLFGLAYARLGLDSYPVECRHVALALERHGFRLAHVVTAYSEEEAALRSAATRWLEAPQGATVPAAAHP